MSVISDIFYQQKKKNWEIAVSLKMPLSWHHSSSAVIIWEKHSNPFSRDSQLSLTVVLLLFRRCRNMQSAPETKHDLFFPLSNANQPPPKQLESFVDKPAQKCVTSLSRFVLCLGCSPWQPTARLVGTGPFSILGLTGLQQWQGIKQCQGLWDTHNSHSTHDSGCSWRPSFHVLLIQETSRTIWLLGRETLSRRALAMRQVHRHGVRWWWC